MPDHLPSTSHSPTDLTIPLITAADYSRLNNRSTRSHHTFHTASLMIFPLILLLPSVRSLKIILISPILKPLRQARNVVSIWKEYPSEVIASRSMPSSTLRR